MSQLLISFPLQLLFSFQPFRFSLSRLPHFSSGLLGFCSNGLLPSSPPLVSSLRAFFFGALLCPAVAPSCSLPLPGASFPSRDLWPFSEPPLLGAFAPSWPFPSRASSSSQVRSPFSWPHPLGVSSPSRELAPFFWPPLLCDVSPSPAAPQDVPPASSPGLRASVLALALVRPACVAARPVSSAALPASSAACLVSSVAVCPAFSAAQSASHAAPLASSVAAPPGFPLFERELCLGGQHFSSHC